MFWDWDFFDHDFWGLEPDDFGLIGGLWGLIEEEMEQEKRIREEDDFFTDDEYED